MTERYQMTLLYWDRNWSQNIRTSASIDRKVSQSVAKCRRDRKFSISATPIAECRRVSQHFSTAVPIRRKVLQNQNSATLCDTCDILRHFAI